MAQSGHQSRIDSLLELSKNVQESPELVDILNQLSTQYYRQPLKASKDSTEIYSAQAMVIARKIECQITER